MKHLNHHFAYSGKTLQECLPDFKKGASPRADLFLRPSYNIRCLEIANQQSKPIENRKRIESIKGSRKLTISNYSKDTFYQSRHSKPLQTRYIHTYFQDINDYLKANKKDQLPDSTKTTLQDQITEMEDPNHRIRDLVQRRIVDFNKQAISTARTAPLQIPPGTVQF